MKRTSLIVIMFVLTSLLLVGLRLLPDARATTLYVGGGGPGNYTMIQAAVDDAFPGDTVYVYNGTYLENVVVNKTLSLVGQHRNATIIDGGGLGDVVRVSSDWVNITGFTVTNSGPNSYRAGIEIWYSKNCRISNNTASVGNYVGIWLRSSSNCAISNNIASSNYWSGIDLYLSNNITITSNVAESNWHGVFLHSSTEAVLKNNLLVDDGIFLRGDLVEYWNTHTIETSNTVNAKPVHYWRNAPGGTIPPGAGQVILANSSGVAVGNQNVSDGTVGIQLGFSTKVTIENNTILRNSRRGISLYASDENMIASNNMSMNRENSVYLESSNDNRIANNNISSNYSAGVITNGTYLYESHNNTVSNNDASGNYRNVYLELSWNNTIADNLFTDNIWAIRLLETSNGCRIIHNNVTGNVRAIDIRDSNSNFIEGNTVSENQYGITLSYSDNNTIRNNTADLNELYAILIEYSSNNTVSENTISSSVYNGIEISYSNNVSVTNNSISDSGRAITLFMSANNTLANNTMVADGVVVFANSLEFWNSHSIDTSNIVNGRPVQYWKNVIGGTIPSGAGQVILGNCSNVRVENQHLTNTSSGIQLGFSSNNTLANNTVADTGSGIVNQFSDDNILMNNSIQDAIVGISLPDFGNRNIVINNVIQSTNLGFLINPGSENNTIYHNNIIENDEQAFDGSATTRWDNGYPSGGNYWSDYVGVDNCSGPNQNVCPDPDGIGDTPYDVDADSRDRYPLMYLWGMPRVPILLDAILTGDNLRNVTLVWSLSPDDGGGLGSVVAYEILRNATYERDGLGYEFVAGVPNGTSAYVDEFAGEGNPEDYFYRICAVDGENNSACTSDQAGKFTRPLSAGPNLISIPLIQPNESIETVLQTIEYNKAWYYDPSSKEWKWYMKFKDYGRGLWSMNHAIGLWVSVMGDSNLTVAGIVPPSTSIHLAKGWNLVSFPSFNASYTVADLKAEVSVGRVEAFDSSASPYFLRVLLDSDVLLAGKGYWMRVNTDSDWIVETA